MASILESWNNPTSLSVWNQSLAAFRGAVTRAQLTLMQQELFDTWAACYNTVLTDRVTPVVVEMVEN